MVGTEVENISLKKATHLEKANHVLEKFIQYATHQDEAAQLHLLKQEGIFRLSGSSPQIDKLYAKIDKDPSTLAFESEEDFVLEPNNVTGFLKRYLLSSNLKWSDAAAAILRAELQRDTQNYDLAKVIQQLIAANHLEEAKMLHNLLHISRLVSLRAATNKMTVSNMFQTFSPTLVNLAQGDDSLAGRLALGAIVATKNNIDTMGLTTVNADGQATFGKTFNETYPTHTAQINQKLKEKYGSKPASDSKFTAFVNSTRDYITNVLIPVSKHFLTKTVPNFFTKTVPSFFKRFTGSKTKGEPLPDKMAVPAELLAAKQQAEAARAEAAKAKEWQAGHGPRQADLDAAFLVERLEPRHAVAPVKDEPRIAFGPLQPQRRGGTLGKDWRGKDDHRGTRSIRQSAGISLSGSLMAHAILLIFPAAKQGPCHPIPRMERRAGAEATSPLHEGSCLKIMHAHKFQPPYSVPRPPQHPGALPAFS